MKSLFLVVFSFVFIPFGQAQVFQPVEHPIGLAEKIIIRGFNGKVQVTPSDTDTIRVEARKVSGMGDGWNYQVRLKGNVVEVVVKGPSEQDDWVKLRQRENLPQFEMKVTAPERPLEVFWDEGQFTALNWKSDLKVQMTSGDIRLKDSKGRAMLQLIKGRVHVADHEGNIDVQSFNGRVNLEKTKGAIHVTNHSAIYNVNEHVGPLDIINHSGSFSVKGAQGSAEVKNVSGVMNLSDFKGSFKGEFEKGALNAQVESLQNFSVNSDEAVIHLDAPKVSGARVSLRSEKGHMRAPIHLGKVRKGRWTERKGRLKGKEQGNIKIISKYGDIVLK